MCSFSFTDLKVCNTRPHDCPFSDPGNWYSWQCQAWGTEHMLGSRKNVATAQGPCPKILPSSHAVKCGTREEEHHEEGQMRCQ